MLELKTIVDILKENFGDAVLEGSTFRGQDIIKVSRPMLLDIAKKLREDDRLSFEMLTDLTAVDFMGEDERFELVLNLYSFKNNKRLRIKTRVPEGESVATVEGVWKAANWLEREVYDLFGIVFDGHSDLRRILLWDGYVGHPLRKDFPLGGIPQKAVYR